MVRPRNRVCVSNGRQAVEICANPHDVINDNMTVLGLAERYLHT